MWIFLTLRGLQTIQYPDFLKVNFYILRMNPA